MNWQIWFLAIVIVIAMILFITEVVSMDIVSLFISVVLMTSGIVSVKDGLSGFSNEAALAILALLIINTGLVKTGVINQISYKLALYTGNSLWSILIILLPTAALLSAFTNNTAVVSIFLPIILSIANIKKISASKLLIPVAYICILGGLCTLIGTSTNLLVNSVARQYKVDTFTFFEFTKIGLILVVICTLYFLLFGNKLIPPRRKTRKLSDEYNIREYLTEITILEGSKLAGNFQKAHQFFTNEKLEVIKIVDKSGNEFFPNENFILVPGDRLLIKGNLEKILVLKRLKDLAIISGENKPHIKLNSKDSVLVEAVISPSSTLSGKMLQEIKFIERYEAVPLAINRSGVRIVDNISNTRLKIGDTLLLEAKKDFMENDEIKNDFIILQFLGEFQTATKKITILSILIGVVLIAALGILPIVVSALAGCLVMFLTGFIKPNEAYEMVEWRVYFLIAGLIPLGIAIQNTGMDFLIGKIFIITTKGLDPLFIISLLFLVTTLITNIMANNATALLMSPIAISIAQQLQINPKALLLTIIFAASTSFFTPMGYHTLTLIYGPGKYKFRDYLVAGLPMTVIVWITASILIHYFYVA